MSAGIASTPESLSTKRHPSLCVPDRKSPAYARMTFFVLIEDHIDDEGKLQGLCRKYHIFVDRISIKDSRSCIRTVDKFGAVVCHDRSLRTETPGRMLFRPPENPAKKCGSIKPSEIRRSASAAIRLTFKIPPDGELPSPSSPLCCGFKCTTKADIVAVQIFLTELICQLLSRGLPVETCRDQNW